MSLGASLAGINVQHVVEADPFAATTYLKNHNPPNGVFVNDIRKYTPPVIDRHSGEPVVVFGGPPCQGFSTSNQRTRSSKNSNNWLFEEFVRVVEAVGPELVVFENVRGILETEKGKFVRHISKSFQKLGYQISYQLLHSQDFGIPQKRARFFLIGIRDAKAFEFPAPTGKEPITVHEAIHDLPKLSNGASTCSLGYRTIAQSDYAASMRKNLETCRNHLVTCNNKEILERYKNIPQGGNWEDIPDHLMGNYKDKSRCHTGIYHRLSNDKPSIVIGNYRKNMLIHPTQNRGLSVREAARLQSFPDNFEFHGSIGFQQQQVGNAVPPLLAKALFESLKNQYL